MSSQSVPAKRPHDQDDAEPNGKGKLQKTTSHKTTPSIVFRMLCHDDKIESVIGKDGNNISQICQESGAEITVEDPVSGCSERVIVIAESGNENGISDEIKKSIDADEEKKENRETQDNDVGEDSQSEKSSSLQKGLMLVFEKMVEKEPEISGGVEGSNKETTTCVVRLLLLSSQVGPLLGISGSVIKQLTSESGAQIRVLPRDKLPSCAFSTDELVQISGEVNAVRKALQSVSQQLLDHLTGDDSFTADKSGSFHSFGSRQDAYPPFPHGEPLPAGPRDGGSGTFGGRFGPFTDMLTYRLICSDEKVGGVIGKGGTVVKALKHETGCDIKVLEKMPESDDRVIVISGPAHPDERICAPQDAVLRVQTRIFKAAPESKAVTAKVIVSAHQIGCILGKGGAVISEMRKSTGAYIRILGKDQTPQYAAANEEVVQINGDYDAVQEALMQITTCLRNHYFRDAFPGFLDHGPPPFPAPYMRRRELSPPGRYPPFNRFDAGGPPPRGGFHLHDDRPPFMHDRPDFPHPMSERLPPWGSQGFEGGPLGFPDFGGRRMGGFGGGNHQTIITNTTVEVVVPRTVVPAIYGEDGGCLRQIREISDAKIIVNDPKPGAKETLIIISGTPEQTHAAQSLIQAFVICETEAS
ncbi:putative K domain-containing protein [Helianthus annuus]|uniref:Putative K-like domain protein n=1 Tax=Helianthus annuus TaxID=4232 RepID=A0A251VMH5_HELAN|nr:KH domain-containing protein HEN4 isoform X1 [Helianthus annuus]KAJ0845889.1 putative K domain-containing protein [Helianthus annuus]